MNGPAVEPADEPQRLRLVHELLQLDTRDDAIYRRKVDILRRVFAVPIALLALTTEREQRFIAVHGLPLAAMPRERAICSLLQQPPFAPLVLTDARDDPRACSSPLVTQHGVRFYAGVPLLLDGAHPVGTLCIMDTAPRRLDAAQTALLADFGAQLAATMQAMLDAQRLLHKARQQEAELARERALLRTVIDGTPSLIAAVDADGRFTLANAAFARMVGSPAQELIGRRLDAVTPPQVQAAYAALRQRMQQRGGAVKDRLSLTLGERTWKLLVTLAPLHDGQGRAQGVVSVVQDMTEFDAISADLEKLQDIQRRGEAFTQQGTWSLDLDSGVMTISEGFARLLGFDPGQRRISHAQLRERIDPRDHAGIDAVFAQARAADTGFRFDYRLATPPGQSPRWLRARGDVVRDAQGRAQAFVGITQDVTEEIDAKRLIDTQHRLLSGLNTAVQAFLQQVQSQSVWDRMLQHLLAVSEADYGFLGEVLFDVEATPCLKIHAITNLSWSVQSDALYARVMAGDMMFCNPDNLIGAVMKERAPVIVPDMRHDPRRGGQPPGHPELTNYLGIPLFQGEELVGVVAIANRSAGVDASLVQLLEPFVSTYAIMIVTLRQRRAQQQYEQQLLESKQQAERANRAKSQFLSSMSHELRTPLNSILGFAQLLGASRREPLSDRQRGFVDHITQAGQHLLSLVNDVLNLAKIEAGELTLSPEPLPLAGLAQTACDMVADLARARQVRIDNQVVDAALHVCADLTRLRQVVLNLLSNAIKYNRPGGSVRVQPLPLQRDAADGVWRCGLAIADTGIGIPADRQHRVFRAFERLGQETGPIEGTGIGLMITRELVERMNGTIGFDSREGEGSTFYVRLPAVLPDAPAGCGQPEGDAPQAAAVAQRAAPSAALRQHLVLYVEDNPANAALMREIAAERDDVRLLLAHDGEQALELALLHRPELILMDINLPGLSGQQAAARQKTWPETAGIPIFALSADATASTRERAQQSGMFSGYLTKPIVLEQIHAVFDALRDGRPLTPVWQEAGG